MVKEYKIVMLNNGREEFHTLQISINDLRDLFKECWAALKNGQPKFNLKDFNFSLLLETKIMVKCYTKYEDTFFVDFYWDKIKDICNLHSIIEQHKIFPTGLNSDEKFGLQKIIIKKIWEESLKWL